MKQLPTLYKATIGLEIHAELKTETKMFCHSKNDPDEKNPNVNICPVCMAHPGTLPVINKKAVKAVLMVGKALGGTLADFTEFDRKNYFYPDIPKGYQISQYKYPLVSGGMLAGVHITRVHLEEDTARSTHDQGAYSLVDFNRAGVPLMELVTEPDIKSAEEAVLFAKELQLLLRYLGVSDANMEKGQMRVEANVSVSKTDELGTKVEVKNLNSFKVVEKAIRFEIERQIKTLDEGGSVVQETRGWDEKTGETFSQRVKESSDDYRYFPDPDLPKLKISEVPEFGDLALPELPEEKRNRYRESYGIKDEDIESYVVNTALGDFFEAVAKIVENDPALVRVASNYITSDIVGYAAKKGALVLPEAKGFAELMRMAHEGVVSSRGAKNILLVLLEKGGSPKRIAQEEGLLQISDVGTLLPIVNTVIEHNKEVAGEYKEGKGRALQFLIGQAMKETNGSANPVVLEDLFKQSLG